MMIDILSETLMKMKLKAYFSGALDAGGHWAVESPSFDGFKLIVVLKGECWISIEGLPGKYHLKPGDCILLTSGKPFIIAKDLSIQRKIQFDELKRSTQNGVMTYNGGGDFYSNSAYFQFEGHLPKIMFGNLPPVIHIPEHMEQAAILRWSLERFSSEVQGDKVGRTLIINHLAPIMLVQILRIYLASAKNEKNWLVALSDPKLSKAIEAMHSDYQRPWSLDELARTAGLSRSGFALNFKKQVGIAPMEYLTNWRMQYACELLQSGDHNVATVASAVGYESESAFSLAFKRIIKCRPGFYQKAHRGLSANADSIN